MKKSEQPSRRVVSYAEAARSRHDGPAASEGSPVIKPGENKIAPPQAPSASAARASTDRHLGGEQLTRAAPYRGPPVLPISGQGPKLSQEIARGKDPAGKAHTEDAQTQTQKQPVTSVNPKPKIQTASHRTFSYADAARGEKKSTTPNQHSCSGTSSNSLVSSSSEIAIHSAVPTSHTAVASTPTTTTLPSDSKPNKRKEIAQRPKQIPPAVPNIDFGLKAMKNKNKNSKKNQKSSSGLSTSLAAAQPAVTSSTQGSAPTSSPTAGLPTVIPTAQTSAPSTAAASGSIMAGSKAQKTALAGSSAAVHLPSSSTAQGPAPAAPSKSKKKNNKNNKKKKQASSKPNNSPTISQSSATLSAHTSDDSTSRPPSQDLSQDQSQASLDDLVESRINDVIAEQQRQWEFQQRELRKMAVIAKHDNNEGVSLWDSQLEWDVKIIWRPKKEEKELSWKVHHDILCRESPYFKRRLPPKNTEGGYVELDCSMHDPQPLATALKYMYDQDYEGGTIDFSNGAGTGSNVPDGEAIRKNVFMYICGAGVACNSLMTLAMDRIDEITETILDNNLISLEFCRTNNLSNFCQPLSVALICLYSQGSRENMWMLRLAMARLLDPILAKMLVNEGFNRSVVDDWVPRGLWHNVWADNAYFASRNELFPVEGVDEEEKAKLVSRIAETMPQKPRTSVSGQAAGEDNVPGDLPPTPATQTDQIDPDQTPKPTPQPAHQARESVQSPPASNDSGQVPSIGVHTTSATPQPSQVSQIDSRAVPTAQPPQETRIGAQSSPGMPLRYASPMHLAQGFKERIQGTLANSQPAEVTQITGSLQDIVATRFSGHMQASEMGGYLPSLSHYAPATRQHVQSTPIISAYTPIGSQLPPLTHAIPDFRRGLHVTPSPNPVHEYIPTTPTSRRPIQSSQAAQSPAPSQHPMPVYTSQDARAYQTPPREHRVRGKMHTDKPDNEDTLRGDNWQDFRVTPERNRGTGGNFGGHFPRGYPATPPTPGTMFRQQEVIGDLQRARAHSFAISLTRPNMHDGYRGCDGSQFATRGPYNDVRRMSGTFRFGAGESPRSGTENVHGICRGHGTGHPSKGPATPSGPRGIFASGRGGYVPPARLVTWAPGFHAQGATMAPAVVPPPVGFVPETALVPANVLVQGQTMGLPIEEALPPTP